MATLRPFAALRPSPSNASAVSAVPYDVVSRDEAAELARGNPLSFLHVSRPEIDLDPSIDPHADEVYEKALTHFEKLRRTAPLVLDSTPALYLYRLKQGAHEQTGIAATFSVREYDQGIIRRHERTRRDKEDDRTRHLLKLKAQTGPSYLAYRGTQEINGWVEKAKSAIAPLFDFTSPDGVTHTIWAVSATEPWVQAFSQVPRLYIADGHHRTASASRAHAKLGAADWSAPHAFFLAVAFPADQLRILPYHRTVQDLCGQTSAKFLENLRKEFCITEGAASTPETGSFSMYLDKCWYGLQPKSAPGIGVTGLDVSVLQDRVLGPLLGIADPRTDKRIDFVGGIRGTGELEKLVDSGRARVAFAVHPTSVEDLMQIADADEIMPPKSTWFEPKLRDGLLSHLLA